MRPVDVSEVRNIAEYELVRPELRPKMMALKDRRRIPVGGHLTFLFENRDTVLYQIQEMMRIERIVKAEEIAHEVRTYNELIPATNELSATLLIEYSDPEVRAVKLQELLGLERHIWLEVDGVRSPALFDNRQIDIDRLSSVQYIKFKLSPAQSAAFGRGARLIVDHPTYKFEHTLTPEQLHELFSDLE